MSFANSRLSWLCILFVFTNTVVPAHGTLADETCGTLDRVANAIRFAQILYPELRRKEFSLQFSEGTGGPLGSAADARTLRMVVDKPEWRPPASDVTGATLEQSASKSEHAQLPLNLHYEFITPATLESKPLLSCSPVLFSNDTEDEEMKRAESVINAHPEWSDEQELQAVQANLHYGPANRAAVLKSIPLRGLGSFYGPLRIEEAEFDLHTKGEKSGSFADLAWYVYAEVVGTRRKLQIIIEPFHGRIVAVTEDNRLQ